MVAMRTRCTLLLLVAFMASMLGGRSAFADDEVFGNETEIAEPAADFFEGLEAMQENELAFKIVKLEIVAGNAKVTDAHFKATLLFQNTSPYTIKNPATSVELLDKEFNTAAFSRVKYEGALKPGQSQGFIAEFDSKIEVTPGQSTKGITVEMNDYLYGERIDDASAIEAKGTYLFINGKQLKVKVADPYGYQYIPAKNLLEAAGFKYVWDVKKSTFTATKGKLKVEHKIGSSTMKVSGKVVKLSSGQTTTLNKVPTMSLNVLKSISSSFAIARGEHDGEIIILSVADQDLIK